MLLGLDLGTTNVKALLCDRRGQALGRGSQPVQLFPVGDGGVEQDLEEIWSAALAAMSQALAGVEPARVEAVGVSSQGGALQLFGERGQSQGRVVSWLDQRGRYDDDALTAELGESWFRERISRGCSGLAIGQLLRLRRESPAALSAPNRVGFVGDLVVSRLCGRPAHDATSCGLTLLFNPRRRGYDPELLDRLGLKVGQLPDLSSAREPAGGLAADVARQTGLRAGTPVSAAIHDQYAAALGTGAVAPGTVMVGAGTAWVLLATSEHLPAPVVNTAFVCTHVVDGLYGQIVSLVNGGSALSWALKLMGRADAKPDEIESLLAAAPPGCTGLGFWPFMTPFGAVGLPPGSKGRLAGIQLGHTQAHLARAVVEGLVCELNRHLRLVVRAGMPVARLVMGGAVAGSPTTTQMLADVTGLPLGCLATGEGSLLGAAVLAQGLLEPARSLADLSGAMRPPARRVEPGANAAFYREHFEAYARGLPNASTEHEPLGRRAVR